MRAHAHRWRAATLGIVWGMALAVMQAASAAEPPSGIATRVSGAGTYLTDAAGHTLYFYDADTPGKSSCVGDCAKAWPPVSAAAEAKEQGPWSVIPREDGARQWAYHGRPLYRFARDTRPGARMGEIGTNGWRIAFDPAPLPAGLTLQRTLEGWAVANAKGLTAYAATGKTKEAYPSPWRPLLAPAIATAGGDWSVIAREDGLRQWAYRGAPLYVSERDRKHGEVNAIDGTHAPVLLDALPVMPPWVTVQVSDTGNILADAQGRTLYVVRDMAKQIRHKTCQEECMRTYWRVVEAMPDATPVGNWSLIPGENGKQLWAYMGMQVFTHTRDEKPGDTAGYGFAVGHGIGGGFRPIMVTALLPTS